MPIPDITDLTIDELRDLIQQANSAYYAAEQAEQNEQEDRRDSIAAEITETEALIQKLVGYRNLTDAQLAEIPVPTIIRELLTAHIDGLTQQADIARVIAADD